MLRRVEDDVGERVEPRGEEEDVRRAAHVRIIRPGGEEEEVAVRRVHPARRQVLLHPDADVEVLVVEAVADPHEQRVRIGAAALRGGHGEDVGALAPMHLSGAVDHLAVAEIAPDEPRQGAPRRMIIGGRDAADDEGGLGDDGAVAVLVEAGVGEDAVPGAAHGL